MSELREYPWAQASATGVGSFPGTDPDEAVRTVMGELPDLPHLPELPERGAGAGITGRGAALLVDFPVEVQPFGWRTVQRPGRDLSRARDYLAYDLDALERHAGSYVGPLKVQLAGPWTLAATVELAGGEKLLADHGAVSDLCESLAEGVREHVAAVRKRVPGARILVQLDEPVLPAVLSGAVPTASQYGRLPAIDRVVVEERLRAAIAAVTASGGWPLAHCCASEVPVDLLRRSGFRALSLDATLLGEDYDEAIGTAVESGMGLLLGAVATDGTATDPPVLSDPAANVDPVRRLWHRIGFSPESLASTVVATPACGLANATLAYAREALTACREAARVLREEPQVS